MLVHAELTRLEESLDHIRAAPADGGTVELIARRPGEDQREVLTEARLNTREGLEGDTWLVRGSSRTPDGDPNPEAQLTLMNARAAAGTLRRRRAEIRELSDRARASPARSELPGRGGRHRAPR